MLKPKVANRPHWEKISDEELLGKDLTTDNPLGLEGLVDKLPDGPEEPHVEFSYDLANEVRCVHGNHRHKHGFVFRKGDHRYLVGWMCGEKLYGQKFNQYTAEFKEARSRQDGMRRVRDLRAAVETFSVWSASDEWTRSIQTLNELRGLLARSMPVVFSTVQAYAGKRLQDVVMPRYLCQRDIDVFPGDPREVNVVEEYNRYLQELRSIAAEFVNPPLVVAASIGRLVERLRGVCRRANILLSKVEDVELFFQPACLHAICEHIGEMKPRRARHFAGLLKISTKNVVITLPSDYRSPARTGLDALETALNAGK